MKLAKKLGASEIIFCPAPRRCDAWTVPATYAEAHRCEKTSGVERVEGKLGLCRHHRGVLERRGRVSIGHGAWIERRSR